MTGGQLAVVLVLISALMHATWNAIVKLSGERLAVMAVVDTICFLIALSATPFVPFPSPAVWPFLGASTVLAIGYKASLLGAYRHGDFTQAYPLMRGSAPLLVAAYAMTLGSDPLSGVTFAGIAIVSIGLLSLVDWTHGKPILLLFALCTGATLAAATLIDGTAVRGYSDPLTYIVWLEVLEHIALPVYAIFNRRPQYLSVLQSQWMPAGIAAVNRIGSYGLMLWAMSLAPIAPLAALRETSVVFGALIGYFILKESFGLKRMVATALVITGIGVLQLSRAVA